MCWKSWHFFSLVPVRNKNYYRLHLRSNNRITFFSTNCETWFLIYFEIGKRIFPFSLCTKFVKKQTFIDVTSNRGCWIESSKWFWFILDFKNRKKILLFPHCYFRNLMLLVLKISVFCKEFLFCLVSMMMKNNVGWINKLFVVVDIVVWSSLLMKIE